MTKLSSFEKLSRRFVARVIAHYPSCTLSLSPVFCSDSHRHSDERDPRPVLYMYIWMFLWCVHVTTCLLRATSHVACNQRTMRDRRSSVRVILLLARFQRSERVPRLGTTSENNFLRRTPAKLAAPPWSVSVVLNKFSTPTGVGRPVIGRPVIALM